VFEKVPKTYIQTFKSLGEQNLARHLVTNVEVIKTPFRKRGGFDIGDSTMGTVVPHNGAHCLFSCKLFGIIRKRVSLKQKLTKQI
jgi:hypothetical protein